MKINEKRWLMAGALASALLAGCAHEYADRDDYHHHRRWSDREYHHRYEGRPPGYQGGTEIYVTPDAPRPNRW